MALREKKKHSGWRVFSGRPGLDALLTASRRGGIYTAVIVFMLWLIFAPNSSTVSSPSPGFGGKLRNQALRLTNSITDEDIYGPEPAPRKHRPPPPSDSAIAPLRSWGNGVPETTVHGISGGKPSGSVHTCPACRGADLPLILPCVLGWSLLDNVVLMNGTLFIVANDRGKIPPLDKMFSTGVPMESEPETWRGRDTTDREMQVVNQEKAHELFGDFGSRIQGATFLCNDAPQCTS